MTWEPPSAEATHAWPWAFLPATKGLAAGQDPSAGWSDACQRECSASSRLKGGELLPRNCSGRRAAAGRCGLTRSLSWAGARRRSRCRAAAAALRLSGQARRSRRCEGVGGGTTERPDADGSEDQNANCKADPKAVVVLEAPG